MKSTYAIAGGIAVVLVLWLLSGQLAGEPEQADSEAAEPGSAATVRVRTQTSTAQPFTVTISASGRTEAKRSVQVRAETSGRITKLPVEKGSVVAAGDLLCQLSVEDSDVKFKQAQTALRHAELEHQGMMKLKQDGLQSEVNIAGAEVSLMNARADVKSRSLDLDYRRIRAPFRGIVQTRPVNIGDFIQRGSICAEVLDPNPMLIVAHVSEQEVQTLSPGDAASVVIAGQRTGGPISFISHAADDITRTYRIEVEIDNSDYRLRGGLSADVYLPRTSVPAHRVSPALLSLNDAGDIGIKLLDQDNRVQFLPVTIVSDTQQGVWLGGLPDTIRLITLGQEFVFQGQVVEAVAIDTLTQAN